MDDAASDERAKAGGGMTWPAGLVTQRQAAALIGRSHHFVAKLEAEGLLARVPGTSCPVLYRRRDLGPWLPEDEPEAAGRLVLASQLPFEITRISDNQQP